MAKPSRPDATVPRPSRAGLALVGATAATYGLGVGLGYRPLLAVATAGLIALIVGVVVAIWRPRLTLHRSFHPRTVVVGEPAVALLQVQNLSAWPSVPVTAVDRMRGRDVRLAVKAMRPGSSALVRYPLPTDRRGRIPLGPLRVERSDPFGLFTSGQGHGDTEVLWVHARTWPMVPLPAGLVVDMEGPVSETALHGSLTFSSLREYVPGDDRRQIHWRSSARLGTLVVRQHVDTNEPRATVLLDTRTIMWNDATFEEGVEVAGSVAAGLASQGHAVAVHVLGLEPSRARELGAFTVPDRLAAAEMTEDPDPSALLASVRHESSGGSLVVVTGLMEPSLEFLLGRQGHRFSPVVICSIVPGMSAVWRRRRGVTIVRGPTARHLAQAWNKMAAQ